MTLGFRAKVFVGSVAAAATSLLVASLLLSWQVRRDWRAAIEDRLTDEARVTADLLSAGVTIEASAFDREADRIGALVGSRVTFIAADGRVVGDSTQTEDELEVLDNHWSRPEVVDAREQGLGVSQRFSTTVGTDMVYVAVPTTHPVVRYVRFALPLTEIDAQLATIRTMTLVALAAAIPVALVVSWMFAAPIARRVHAVAAVAKRYAAGDTSQPVYDYGADELGEVARALDGSVQELGRRVAELSRDRARIDATLSGMVEGVLVIDQQGRLQILNRAARAMLQVEGSALGRSYLEVIRQPDIATQFASALEGEDRGGCEVVLVRDPARIVVARAAPVAAPSGGGAVLVLHDITDLRRADQVRRDFVANVSHELRTPLTAIRGYVEALLDEPASSDRARGFLDIIARHSGRMERLVTDLLRLARLDAGQEVLDLAACDVRTTFDTVVADLGPAIEAKRQLLTIDVPLEAGWVLADPSKLHDILRNLVENAVHYAPERARIQLSAGRQDRSVILTVADSGPGIPAEALTRVFERFYRVDKSRARPGGTGLGLAIVKHLVELHEGSVAVTNHPGGGASFTVTLRAPLENLTA